MSFLLILSLFAQEDLPVLGEETAPVSMAMAEAETLLTQEGLGLAVRDATGGETAQTVANATTSYAQEILTALEISTPNVLRIRTALASGQTQ